MYVCIYRFSCICSIDLYQRVPWKVALLSAVFELAAGFASSVIYPGLPGVLSCVRTDEAPSNPVTCGGMRIVHLSPGARETRVR
jgi:hypothetical protein